MKKITMIMAGIFLWSSIKKTLKTQSKRVIHFADKSSKPFNRTYLHIVCLDKWLSKCYEQPSDLPPEVWLAEDDTLITLNPKLVSNCSKCCEATGK